MAAGRTASGLRTGRGQVVDMLQTCCVQVADMPGQRKGEERKGKGKENKTKHSQRKEERKDKKSTCARARAGDGVLPVCLAGEK